MKVLWVGHNLAYPPKGGALQRNYNLLRQAAAHAEVHFIGLDQARTRPSDIQPDDCIKSLKGFCGSADWVPLSQSVGRFHRHVLAARSLVSKNPYELHWLRSRQLQAKLAGLFRLHRFDVVHFDTLGLAQYIPLANKCGTVLNHHDVQAALMARRMELETNPLLKQYWWIETRKLRHAELHWGERVDMNLVCSAEEAALLIGEKSSIRTAIVANGVDTAYFCPRPDPGGQTLLFCGSLDMYPNQDAVKYFLEAIWPALRSRHKDIQIYMVGRQPPDWLKSRAETDNRLHVTGFVDDVRSYFRKATVCVCPIREGGGTRLKILDSLAMGVPVIGTSFACLGLNLRHDRDVIMADSADDFVRHVGRLLDRADLRQRIGSAGRQVAEREYSWDVIGKNLVRAYEGVVELKRRAQ